MVLSLATAATFAWVLLPIALFLACAGVMPVLRRNFAFCYRQKVPRDWWDRVALRYVKLGTHPWSFAWFKLRMDPMFRELPELVKSGPPFRHVLDLGCGYGFAACSMLEWNADVKIFGIDPNAERVRVAAAAFGLRGRAAVGGAPDFLVPGLPERFDGVFVLDVIHYIPDAALGLTLQRARDRLDGGGRLIIRSIVRPAEGKGGSLLWRLASVSRRLTGSQAHHRSVDQIRAAITAAGFTIGRCEMSGSSPEMFWFVASGPAPAAALNGGGAPR